MIDTRFPPQPKKIKVPLYPLESKLTFPSMDVIDLRTTFKKLLPKNSLFLTSNSATDALYLYLKWKKEKVKKNIRIALPAFCCPHLCSMIIKSKCHLIFMDIDKQYGISKKSVNFAVKKKADIILWPNYFAYRSRSKTIIKKIDDLNIELILDEAQTFPIIELSNNYISLISFGKSKRLQAKSGGGICIPENKANSTLPLFFKKYQQKIKFEYYNHIKFILVQYANTLLKISQKTEKHLPLLLEKTICHQNIEYNASLLSNFTKNHINYNNNKLKNNNKKLKILCEKLSDFVEHKFSKKALDIIKKSIGLPTTFAIRVPAKRRYTISSKLAKHGVQTTWYYYPLNKISFFSQFDTEATPNTNKLSSEILILPYSLGTSIHNLKEYSKILESLYNESF